MLVPAGRPQAWCSSAHQENERDRGWMSFSSTLPLSISLILINSEIMPALMELFDIDSSVFTYLGIHESHKRLKKAPAAIVNM